MSLTRSKAETPGHDLARVDAIGDATDRPGSRSRCAENSADSVAARMAILGNLGVGKTTLFGNLCSDGGHSVLVPGSGESIARGVSAVSLGRHAERLRRQCARCSHSPMFRAQESAVPSLGCTQGHGGAECPARRLSLDRCRPPADMKACCPECGASNAPTLPEITHLFDAPGSATLVATREDEMVARDLILSGEMNAVLLVADAKNLRRSLAFAFEVIEFGLPMILVLNMVDEAESLGIDIDDAALSNLLGVPVLRSIAVEDAGTRRLAEQLAYARTPTWRTRFPLEIESAITRIGQIVGDKAEAEFSAGRVRPPPSSPPSPFSSHWLSPRGIALLLVAGDGGAESWVTHHLTADARRAIDAVVEDVRSHFKTPIDVLLSETFHRESDQLVERVTTAKASVPSLLARFGSLSQKPFPGILIAIAVLVLAYEWVGAFGATYVVDNLAEHIFEGQLVPWCQSIVAHLPSAFLRDAIMDPDFGLLPTGLFLAVGIVLPVLFCFYLMQSVLEDSGYLPRLSVLFNRIFQWLGLNGQALIPLILGFSCITMAIITTRMLPTKKERLIMTMLLVSGLPCAPLLAVMLVILGKISWTASVFLAAFLIMQIFVVGMAASRLLPGKSQGLILEIPRMRVPRPRIVLVKTWRRTMEFMREAVPIFLIASFAVFVFDRVGGLDGLERAARPLVNGWLGLPDSAVQIFVKTVIRRESGATELNLLRDQYDNVQVVVTLLVMTVLLPCINASIVVIKERGVKVAALILGAAMTYAFVAGTAASALCRALGISFT